MKANLISWGVFAAFVACAIGFGWHAALFRFDGPMGLAKIVVWLAFLLFTAYSIYCSGRENIFKTIRTMARLHWGRQIGTDLYLGLLLFLAVRRDPFRNAGRPVLPMTYRSPERNPGAGAGCIPGCRGACHRARIRVTRWLIRATRILTNPAASACHVAPPIGRALCSPPSRRPSAPSPRPKPRGRRWHPHR